MFYSYKKWELFPFLYYPVKLEGSFGVVGACPYSARMAACAAAPDALDMGVVGACPCEK